MKVRPFYDRRDLIALTTRTVEDNLLRGMLLVIVVLIFFLYDIRSGLIVAVTIPLSLLFAFICLDLKHVPANLLSIGAIDFGILVDGAVVMVENIFRRLALNGDGDELHSVTQVIIAAAAEVDRPIFYAVAVIVAGFLPIYALTGPVGRAVPADGRHDDLRAARRRCSSTLTLLPVLCAWVLRRGVRERAQRHLRVDPRRATRSGLDCCLTHPWATTIVVGGDLRRPRCCSVPSIGAEFMPHLDEGALWVRATMPYTISFEESSKIVAAGARDPALVPARSRSSTSEHGRADDGTDPTGFFNAEFFVGLKPYERWTRRVSARRPS